MNNACCFAHLAFGSYLAVSAIHSFKLLEKVGLTPLCIQPINPKSIPGHNIQILPGSSKVKGVDKAKGGGTSSTTRGKVTKEEPPELCPLVHTTKEDLKNKQYYVKEKYPR